MPTFKFTAPDGKKYTVNGPEGATEQQAFQMLQTQLGASKLAAPTPAPPPDKPFGAQMNDAVADMPRQVGLTARYGIEGVGGVLNFLTSPVRGGMNLVLPKQQTIQGMMAGSGAQDAIQPMNFKGMADAVGLPEPRTPMERVVGDASRMVAGGMVPMAAGATLARNTTGVAQGVGSALAANPIQQLASAGAAGAAGGYVRETGGNAGSQLIASLAAGLAAPYAMNKGQQAGMSLQQLMKGRQLPTAAQMDIQINDALRGNGMMLEQMPLDVQAGIRQDVAKAYAISDDLSPDALRRLADYRLTGAAPTAGALTLDPAVVTQQKNLAKLGINSKDVAAQQLGRTENENNQRLIELMNNTGAKTTDTALVGAQKVIDALGKRDARAKALIGERYATARATDGRSAALDPHAFTNKANDLLDEALLGGKLPADVRGLLNKAAEGKMPLTVDVAEQLKTRIGDLQRSTMDKAERNALGMVRQALDDTPLLSGQGQGAIDAFNRARKLHRAYMQIVERTPALQAVRDGIEPDKFVQQFITGGGNKANVADLAALRQSVKNSPEAMTAVKEQIASHLKKAALNGAADEVGSVSQSAYNKALSAIGEPRLGMFFTKPEVAQLKAIGRVASYEQFQPRGSAVNNSNTAAAGLSAILDRIANSTVLSKIPMGRLLAEPVQNISVGIKSGKALDAPAALAGQPALPPARSRAPLLMSPAALAGSEE